jgi:hypothetical protein
VVNGELEYNYHSEEVLERIGKELDEMGNRVLK